MSSDSKKNQQISKELLKSLFKSAFFDKNVLKVVCDKLKYEYLAFEEAKELLTYFKVRLSRSEMPVFSECFQYFEDNGKLSVATFLMQIRETDIEDWRELGRGFDTFLKNMYFREHFTKVRNSFVEGKDDIDKTFEIMSAVVKGVDKAGLQNSGMVMERVFADYGERVEQRKQKEKLSNIKAPTGIDEFDALLKGGLKEGDVMLILAGSGVGKTTAMRHFALSAARKYGMDVLHFQCEGSGEEALEGFDASWTGVLKEDLEFCNISDSVLSKHKVQIANHLALGYGEIYVCPFAEFSKPSIDEVESTIQEYIKNHGKPPSLITIDYISLFDPPKGRHYKDNREAWTELAQSIRRIAVKYKTRIITAWQSNDIPREFTENPEFVLTRNNLSEFKRFVDPFTVFITLNQTDNEKESGIIRLFVDKCRHYKSKVTIRIFSDYERGRFYDREKTLDVFFDLESGKKKREEKPSIPVQTDSDDGQKITARPTVKKNLFKKI
jgi:RecA/RadA recombinase